MYKISVTTTFAAAHKIIGYPGNCKRIHGHNWKITVQIETPRLDKNGIGYDFRELKLDVDNIVNKFDHQYLNDLPPFNDVNPTSENIAKYIFDSLKTSLPSNIKLNWVEVKESENYSLIYTED